MKKALIVTTVSGFLLQFERENVRILQDLGYEVHYATNMHNPKYIFTEEEQDRLNVIWHDIPICQSPFRIVENFRAKKMVESLIRKEHISLIHCNNPMGGVVGRLAARKDYGWDVKVVYTAHGFHFYKGAPLPASRIYEAVERSLAHSTDALVVINREDYQNARKFTLREGGMLRRIPGVGLDMEEFAPYTDEQRLENRQKLGIQDGAFFLVCVGELNKNKNQQVIIKALDRIRNSDAESRPIFCAICGEGSERKNLEKNIQKAHLEDQIVLYGYCHPVTPIIGCADAMIFPSHREGMGMAALEALAMGIPVIAADNRGTREYMLHRENGWLCGPDDVDEYVRGIKYLMELSPGEMQEMRKTCRESVKDFSKEKTNGVMQALYERLDHEICAAMKT